VPCGVVSGVGATKGTDITPGLRSLAHLTVVLISLHVVREALLVILRGHHDFVFS
jgi:hypothetical protein